MTPKILLTETSRWPGAARLAIGLSNAGCLVFAVCPIPDHPVLKVHTLQRAFPYSSFRPLDSLANAIEEVQPHIIIPCDDLAVQHLHQLYVRALPQGGSTAKLNTLIERSLGSPASFSVVSSRYDLLSLAREEGIRIPDTTRVSSLRELKSWYAGAARAAVLKADGTWGGNGVRIAHNPQQGEQCFSELSSRPSLLQATQRFLLNRDRFWLFPGWRHAIPGIIVQEFIYGRSANCAAFCWNGEVLAGIAVEVVSERFPNGPAAVVRVVDSSRMLPTAQKIARRLNLSGFFGLDFMIEDGSEIPFLIEMNPRCTQLCHLQLGQGRDMIAALFAQLSGQTLKQTPPVTHNELIAYFPQTPISRNEFLSSCFHDIPVSEPGLIKYLLQPSCERTQLGRILDQLRRLTTPCKESKTSPIHHGVGDPNVVAIKDSVGL